MVVVAFNPDRSFKFVSRSATHAVGLINSLFILILVRGEENMHNMFRYYKTAKESSLSDPDGSGYFRRFGSGL